MAFKKQISEFKTLLLVLIGIPMIASTNIDCGGKSFHCVNSTHFMICVDLGGGVSSTVDDFVISCPPPTVCQGTNHFECEFPAPTTPLPMPPSDITNEIGTTQQWEPISVTTTFPKNVSEEHLDLYVDGTSVTLADVTTDIPIQTTPQFNANESVTENNVKITTESRIGNTVFTKANSVNVSNIDSNTTIIKSNERESQTTFNQSEGKVISGSSTIATDTTITSEMSQNPISNETNINLEENQTQLNNTETKITADISIIPTHTIISETTYNPITLTTSSNVEKIVNTETIVMFNSATEISTTVNQLLLPNNVIDKSMDTLTTLVLPEDIYTTMSTPDSVTILTENAAEIVTAPLMMGEVQTTVEPFNHSEITSEHLSTKSLINTTGSVYESGIEKDVITTTESLIFETIVLTELINSTNETSSLLINVTGIDENETASNNIVNSQINLKYAENEGIGLTTILTNIPGINEAPDTPTTEVSMSELSISDIANDRPIKSTTLVTTNDKLDSGIASTTDILTRTATKSVYEFSTVKTSGDFTVAENVLPTTSSVIASNSNSMTTAENISKIETVAPNIEVFTLNDTETTTISDLPHSEIVGMLVSTTTPISTELKESSTAGEPQITEIYEKTTMDGIHIKKELLITTDNILIPTGNTGIPQTTITSNGTTENNIMDQDIIGNKSYRTEQEMSTPFYEATLMSSSSSDLDKITDEAAVTTNPVIKIDLNTQVSDVPAIIVTNSSITSNLKENAYVVIPQGDSQNKTALNQTQQTEIRQPSLSRNENAITHWPEVSTSATTAYDNIIEHKTAQIERTTENSNIANISEQYLNLNANLPPVKELEDAPHIASNGLNISENNLSKISQKVEESTEAMKVNTENSLLQSTYDSVVNSFTKTTNNSILNIDYLSTTTASYETSTKSNETNSNKVSSSVTPQDNLTYNGSEIDTTTLSTYEYTALSTAETVRNSSQGIVETDVNLSDGADITTKSITLTADQINYSSSNNLFIVTSTATPNVEISSQNPIEIILTSVPTQGTSKSISTLNFNGLTQTEDVTLTTSIFNPEDTTSKPIIKNPLEDNISHFQENVTTVKTSSVVSEKDLFNESSLAATIVSNKTPDKQNVSKEQDIFTQTISDSSSTLTVNAQVGETETATIVKELVSLSDQEQYDLVNKSKPSQNTSVTATWSHNTEFVTANPILQNTSQFNEKGTAKNVNTEYKVNNPSQNVILNNVSSIEEAARIPLTTTVFPVNISEENRLTTENHSFVTTTAESIVRENKNVSTPDKIIVLTINSDGSASYASENESLPTQAVQSVTTESGDVTENLVIKDDIGISMTLKTDNSSTDDVNKGLVNSQPHIIPIKVTENTVRPNQDGIIITGPNNLISSFDNIHPKQDTVEIPASLPTEKFSINEPQIVLVSNPIHGEVIATTIKTNENSTTITGFDNSTVSLNDVHIAAILNKTVFDETSSSVGGIISTVGNTIPNEVVITTTGANTLMSSLSSGYQKEDNIEMPASLQTESSLINNTEKALFNSQTQFQMVAKTVIPSEDRITMTGLNTTIASTSKIQAGTYLVNRTQNSPVNIPLQGNVIEHTVMPNEDVKTITGSNKSISPLINIQPEASKDALNKTTSSIYVGGITSNVVKSMFTSETTVTNEINQKTTSQNVEELLQLQSNKTVVGTQVNTETTIPEKSLLHQEITLNASNDQATIKELQNYTGKPPHEEDKIQMTSSRDDKQVTDSSIPISTVSLALIGGANDEAQLKITSSSLTSNKQEISNDFLTTITPFAGTISGWDSKLDSLAISKINNRELSIMRSFTENKYDRNTENTLNVDYPINTSPQKTSTVEETVVHSVNKNDGHGIDAIETTDKTNGLDNTNIDIVSQIEAINKTSMIGHKSVTIQQYSTNKDSNTNANVEISTQDSLNDAKGHFKTVTESMNPQVKDNAKSSSISDVITSTSSYAPYIDYSSPITFSKPKLTDRINRPLDNEEAYENLNISEVGQASTQSSGTIEMVTKENKKVSNVAATLVPIDTATETLNIVQQKPLENITNTYVVNNINKNRSKLSHTESALVILPRQVTNSQYAGKTSNAPIPQFAEVSPSKIGVTLQIEETTIRSIQKTSSNLDDQIATKTTTKSLATTTLKPTTMTNERINTNQQKSVTTKPNFTCKNRIRGRYSDPNDCRKFYICIGRQEPIIGLCPANTVFSEVKTQCTKNLSYCIRNNQFKCVSEGRFSDYLQQNVYYICVEDRMHNFVRFKFQCQTGYYLNKTSVRCSKNPEIVNLSSSVDISKSTTEKKSKEETKLKKEEDDFECDMEGKFADENNCRRYYVCKKTNRSEEFRRRIKKCDSDEVFHKEKKKCVDAESYEC